MRKSKNLMLLGLSAVVGGVAIGVVGTQFGRLAAHADGHCADGEHNGNHYEAVTATTAHAGNEEFWACCECGEAFLANPGGTWVDKGAFDGELPSDHVAYVAPVVCEHDYKYHVKSFVAGSAVVQLYCADCASYTGEEKTVAAPASFTKALGADYATAMAGAVEVTFSSTYGMAWSDAKNGFVSTNQKKSSTKSQVTLTFASAGTVEFEVGSDAESSWDYVKCLSSDASKITNVISNGTAQSSITAVTTSGQITKKVTADVAAGAQITFSFEKDGSGDNGTDTGWVRNILVGSPAFADGAEEVAVTLEANNGVELDPVVTLKGNEPEMPTPTKSDYYFAGWFSDAEFNIPFAGAVNEDVRVYAKWLDASQQNVLMGKSYGYYVSSGTYSSVSASATVFMEVDFVGNYRIQINNSTYAEGTLSTYNEETGVILDNKGNQFIYDDEANLIYAFFKNGSNTYVVVCEKGSTTSCSSSNMKAAYFGNGNQKLVRVYKDSAYHWGYFDLENNKAYKDVTVEVLSGTGTISEPSDCAKNFLVAVKQDDTTLAKFGYSGSSSTLDKADSEYSGVYTNENGETLAISVTTSKKYARYSGHTSASSNLTVSELSGDTVRIFSSASYDYSATLDRTNHTFTIVANTIAVNIVWNGHSPENAAVSLDFVSGKWVYLSDLPCSVGTVITEDDRNFKLEGWYSNVELTTKISSSFRVEAETTVYAKWVELLDATLTFNSNGGSACESQTVLTGNSYTGTLPTPTLEGHKFGGWFLDEECTIPFNASATIEGDFTLHAKWIAAPAWSVLETAPDATVEGDLITVSGSTTQDFTTRYTKVHLDAGTYLFKTNTGSYHAGNSGVSSQYYQRFEIVAADGTPVINKAFGLRDNSERIEIAVAGDYYIKVNATGYGMASTTGTTGQADGGYVDNYEIKFAKASNYSVETAGTYVVGDTLAPAFVGGLTYDKYYKVHLEQGHQYEFRYQGTNSYAKVTISSDGTTSSNKCFKFGGTTAYLYCNQVADKVVTAEFDMETGDYYIITSYANQFTITDLTTSGGTELEIDGAWANDYLYVDFTIADRKMTFNDMMNSVDGEVLELIDSTADTWTFYGEGVNTYRVVITKIGDDYYITSYENDGSEMCDGDIEDLILTVAE